MTGPVLTIAEREVREGLRNRWVVAATGLLALLALVLAFLGAAPSGAVGAGSLAVTVVSLTSLSIYLLPLIALLLSFDAIAGERERGTLLLLLSYPISRWQVLAGKFVGQAAILAFATVVGYGLAAVAVVIAAEGAQDWTAFAWLLASSVLLGWAFVAVGQMLSGLVTERATAAGLAIAVWLLLVVLYDMGLLALLVATAGKGWIGDAVMPALLLNPADAYRLLNLTVSPDVGQLAGLSAVTGGLSPLVPLIAQVTWIALPLCVGWAVFRKREL